jgi:2-haloacid dehalogenase
MPSRYLWLLFDADDTLFDYRRAEGEALRQAFEGQGLPFDTAWLAAYQRINGLAWRALEAGTITPARLRVMRFELLADELGLRLDPAAFSAVYLHQLAMQSQLVDGAMAMVEALVPRHRLAIITNGLADVQRPRLAHSPLASLIEHLVISEEVGAAKPDPAIFAVALERMDRPDPRTVLMVGDSLRSDIAGGVAAGLDTCWFNPEARPRDGGPRATYEIRRLDEVPAIASGGIRPT